MRANVHISEKFNCIYVQTQKVACTTILKTMQIQEAGGETPHLTASPHKREFSLLAQIPLFALTSRDPLLEGSYFRFSFVRNPYTRVVSAFLDRLGSKQPLRNRYIKKLGLPENSELPFLDFLKILNESDPRRMNKHWMPLTLLTQIDRVNYDFIGRVENFSHDFDHVLRTIYKKNYDDKRYRRAHHATGASAKVLDLIGSNEKQLIEKIYEQDFENFNYRTTLDAI